MYDQLGPQALAKTDDVQTCKNEKLDLLAE